MVKVTQYDRAKKKAAKESFRAEIKKRKYGVWQNMLYILREICRADKLMIIACFVFALFMYAANLCAVFTDKYVVELAAAGFGSMSLLVAAIALIVGTRACDMISNIAANYQWLCGYNKLFELFTLKIMHKNMTTDYENNEKPATSDRLNKARESLGVISTNTALNFRGTIRHTMEFFTYSALLSALDIRILPIIVLSAIARFYIERHKMNWEWNMQDNWQKYDRQLDYIRNEESDFSGAKDVRIFGMQQWFEKAFSRSLKERLSWIRQQDAWSFRHDLLSAVVGFVGNFGAYGFLIWLSVNENVGAGDFVLFFNSVFRLKTATDEWCTNMSGYQWISGNINNYREYLETEDSTERGKGVPLPKGECEIEFRNVTYTYGGAEKPTINGLSFTLHKGERLALVGLNGAGKTTIVKLMCGLYDPTEGEILLNGVNIKEYNREEYFKLFSAVFQDISIMAVNVAENITGQLTEEIDREKLFDCMKKSGIYDKAMSLPEKENTPLVRSVFQNSVDLSGGEAQKLALAKALYKGAPILLLDEPTAALDPISEHDIYTKFNGIVGTRTAIYISHRLSSCRFCDEITVMENGSIVERGSHGDLLQKGGVYNALWNAQAEYYKDTAGELFA